MRGSRMRIERTARVWLLLGGASWAIGCGMDVIDTVDAPATRFSAADCAAAAQDAVAFPDPDFSVISPPTYNACGTAYVVNVGTGGRPGVVGGSGGATFHHDLLVAYGGGAVTSASQCHQMYGAAYFYAHPPHGRYQSIGLKAAPGWWLHQRATCVPPQVNLRDFDQYLGSSVGDMRIAATMRDLDDPALTLVVSAIQYSVKTPTGCSGGVARLLPEQGLFTGQATYSCDGRFQLAMRDDGNLVLAQKDSDGVYSTILWATDTSGVPGANMVKLRPDGELVLSASDGMTIWSSDAGGGPGSYLALSDDGDMNLYDRDRRVVWQTMTGGH
jgi:hypothetical protein